MASLVAEVGVSHRLRYVDIGINLADPVYRGRYHGQQRHPDDLADVVQRAREVGCTKLIVTGSSFKSSRDALQLAGQFPHTIYTTAGIHPCSSAIFERRHTRHHELDEDEPADEQHTPACGPSPSQLPVEEEDSKIDAAKTATILADLQALVVAGATPREDGSHGPLVAFGELGLDYDRLHYCSASTQRHAFAAQLALVAELAAPFPTASKTGIARPPVRLPLFLHSRACHADFVRLLQTQFGPQLAELPRGGVVHSFTGTAAEAAELVALGLHLGINGCSLKTAENCAVVQTIPLDRLLLETDGPWCEVRPSHAGWAYLVEATEAKAKAEAEAKIDVEAETADAAQAKTTALDARPLRKKQPPQTKKKAEPAVSARFKTVKKEKWETGAMVKGRNEPCTIERIATIVAAIKGVPVEEVCEAAWANTVRLFGLEDVDYISS